MTEAELAQIESELDLELPSYYRDFIANYPPLLLALPNGPSCWELCNAPDHIVSLNRRPLALRAEE